MMKKFFKSNPPATDTLPKENMKIHSSWSELTFSSIHTGTECSIVVQAHIVCFYTTSCCRLPPCIFCLPLPLFHSRINAVLSFQFISSLHWLILVLFYALFEQWSFLEVTDCVGGSTQNVSLPKDVVLHKESK